MGKKLLTFLLTGAFCALLCLPTAQAVTTSAASAILMDAASGKVLFSQNERSERSIASITKLMTALVAVERCGDLDALVKVDPSAVGVEGSSMYLAYGEELSLRELLYGLLLRSGNDAAVAIAIHCAGDVETFVGWMNERAERLGMTHSHFENPNGLEGEGHYSCAYDMALLARAVLAVPELAEIAATRSITLGSRTLVNHNKLLWRYEGCIGLKTGYTQKAGRTLVSAARRGETTLIAVTLNDGNDWADHAALLDYGFANWQSHLLARAAKPVALLPVAGSVTPYVSVVTGKTLRYPLQSGETVTARLTLPQRLEAPVEQGAAVGRLTYYLEGREIGHVPLLAAAEVPTDHPARRKGLLRAFRPLTLAPVEAPAAMAGKTALLPEG